MKPAPFAYHRPQIVSDAIGLLGRFGGDCKLLAGGQSLGPILNFRLARPDHLIDLNDLLELDYVRLDGATVEIGSLTRHHRLATDPEVARACPLLAAAAASIGHYAIRQRGTIGGSLSHADPAAQLPLIAILFDADIHIASPAGSSAVKARDFFVSSLVTVLEPDAMVTAIRFPIMPAARGWGLEIFAQRRGDFAIVSVAATLGLSADGRIDSLAVALGGVATVPISMHAVLAGFTRRIPDAGWRADVGAAVAAAIAPEDDKRLPAQYRRELAETLTIDALASATERAGDGRIP